MISLFIFGPVIVSHSTDPESMQNTVSPLSAETHRCAQLT